MLVLDRADYFMIGHIQCDKKQSAEAAFLHQHKAINFHYHLFKEKKLAAQGYKHMCLLAQMKAYDIPMRQLVPISHIFLRQISTIRSHDGGKERYFGNHKVNSYHLQSTRGAQPPGQLSL